jgi:hypothetical protein
MQKVPGRVFFAQAADRIWALMLVPHPLFGAGSWFLL